MEEKYAEALRLYCTTSLSAARLAAQHGKIRRYGSTTESMKSIARYLGLNYAALNGFIRRNLPELVGRHDEAQKRRRRVRI